MGNLHVGHRKLSFGGGDRFGYSSSRERKTELTNPRIDSSRIEAIHIAVAMKRRAYQASRQPPAGRGASRGGGAV
ncbi:hypothetical protein ACS0ZG_38000, partial [Burkholderia gladioli]